MADMKKDVPVSLMHAAHGQLKGRKPTLAVLPWGATEAHNQHLPYGTDTLEAERFAQRSAELAATRGARVIVLPTIPFGNNAQQQDQVASIHLSTTTALAILRDVANSLKRQGIERLLILNSHGGNEFKPLVRDLTLETGIFIAVASFWQMCTEMQRELFGDPGDHAGLLETSLLLHWCPEWVQMDLAGPGKRKSFAVRSLEQKGVWTPRPWTKIHPDLGAGDPRGATAEKGKQIFEAISEALAQLLVDLSKAKRLP
jgi:creatinine amidohydrolase